MSLEDDLSRIHKAEVVLGNIYIGKDGRKRISVKIDGVWTTRQYAKLLMEQKADRPLSRSETVDHEDNDKSNDDPNNLQILSRAKNAAKAHIGVSDYTRLRRSTDDLRASVIGEKNPAAHFSDSEVVHFRELVKSGNITRDELVKQLGSSDRTVRNMLNGSSYSHLPGYISAGPPGRGSIVIDEVIISKIKELKLSGLSNRAIGREI